MSAPSARRIAAPTAPEEMPVEDVRMSDEEFERQMAIAAQEAALEGDAPSPEQAVDHEPTIEEIQAQLDDIRRQQHRAALLAELAAAKAQMRTVAVARASVPKHDPDRDSPNTWILMEHAQDEAMLSEAWLDEYCPTKREQRMMETVLPLAQLRKDDSVMALVRGKPTGPVNPLLKAMRTPQGEVLSSPRDRDELLSEMRLTPIIRLRDHWVDGAGFGRYSGQLNRATFLEALGKVITPLCPRFLDVVRKEGQPEQLVIRSL